MTGAGEEVRQYRILEVLGHGGMGVVYRAEDTELGRQVALKALPETAAVDQEAMTRLRREARVLASLTHPCIVKIFGVEEAGGQTYIAMELAEGTTLDRAIPSEGFPLEQFFRLAVPLTDALCEAHDHGIIHRDLKPTNLVVTPEKRIKILDFGLAKLFEEPPGDAWDETATAPLSAPGTVAGTLAYMAPETLRGDPADQRSDVFSVGIILYMMATGRHPFGGEVRSGADVASAILRDEPPALSQLGSDSPRQLGRILRSCLEKDPERRFQSMKDLRNQLEMLEEELGAGGAAEPAPPGSSPRWRLPALIVGTVVVSAALVAGWLEWRGQRMAPASRLPHVAVAQHRSFTGSEGPEYFREGLRLLFAERLAGLQGAWIVPPRGDPVPDLLLQTDVRKSGDSVNMAIQVWDQEKRRALSNEVFQGSATHPFELLDRAATEVAKVVEAWHERPIDYRPGPVPTEDPKALEYYLRARAAGAQHEGATASDWLVTLAEQAVAADPGFARAHALEGSLRLARAQFAGSPEGPEETARHCRRAIELAPSLAEGHLCLGQVHARTGHFEEAERELVRAIELDPTLLAAYEELIDLFHELGHPDRAQAVWDRIIERHPEFWAGHWALGLFHAGANRLERAIEQYWRALEAGPDNAQVYWYLGAAHFLLGRYEEAIVAYQMSLAIRPTYQAHNNLGHVHLLVGRLPEAIEAFEAAVSFERETCRTLGNLGAALALSTERRDEAREQFEAAEDACRRHLEENPRDAGGWAWLSYVRGRLGQEEASLEALEKAFELEPNSAHFHYFAARIHSHLGNRERALRSLEQAVAGGYPKTEIRLSPDLDDLRDTPRYRELLRPPRTEDLTEDR